MTETKLTPKAIGVIRRLIGEYTSRDELKQFLLEAGADSSRLLSIQVSSNMQSKEYLSKSAILNKGFDTVYDDFDPVEADGILLELIRLLFDRHQVSEKDRADLEQALSASGFALGQVLEPSGVADVVRMATDVSDSGSLNEAHALVKKALMRMTTDPSGAITAAVSAAESVCREALSRLGIPEPNKKQLPDYLVELRRSSNIGELAWVANIEDRAIKSLSSLAENVYQAAHETGDRHAHGDSAPAPSQFVVDMLVSGVCTITIVISGALRRNELTLKRNTGAKTNV